MAPAEGSFMPSIRFTHVCSLTFLAALLSAACSSGDSGGNGGGLPVNTAGAAGAVGAGGTLTAMAGAAGMAAGTAGAIGASGGAGGMNSGGGMGGMTAAAGTTAGGGSGGAGAMTDERPWFSFFTTSMDGLMRYHYGEGNVPANLDEAGPGGDLGGLEGADAICAALAQEGNPGDQKVWRAFLSTASGGPGEAVSAIDRIGDGPWYDWNNRLFAMNTSNLTNPDDGRPSGIDAQLRDMFTDEYGNPIQVENEDNHDMLTGSEADGSVAGGLEETCQNWTSSAELNNDSDIQVGHAWPRSNDSGRHWLAEHTVRGCMPGVHINGTGGADEGDQRVGAGGGYGGFYCFALSSE
jgi:hypothetical protein